MLNTLVYSNQYDQRHEVTAYGALYITNIVLSMLYAEICPKVRRHNARPIFRHITWTTQYYCYYYSECLW